MTWGEFCTLLSGISAETPLGNIVQIRSEEDNEKIKNFTPQQRKIRDDWQMKLMDKQHKEIEEMTEEEKLEQIKMVQNMFAKAFS